MGLRGAKVTPDRAYLIILTGNAGQCHGVSQSRPSIGQLGFPQAVDTTVAAVWNSLLVPNGSGFGSVNLGNFDRGNFKLHAGQCHVASKNRSSLGQLGFPRAFDTITAGM